MPAEPSKHSIRCSYATRVGSWTSSVLAVVAIIEALRSGTWHYGAAALVLAAFALISYRKAKNDFITIDDYQLTVANHPWGMAHPETFTWSTISELEVLIGGLLINTSKGSVRVSLKEFPMGTTRRIVKATKEKAPWAAVKWRWRP
jgi:hypothetical protein